MNERIDELLWQAGGFNKISNPNDSYLDGKYILSQEQIDMFAELIIKECMLAVYDDGQDAEYYQNRIAKRFGVENE